MMEQGQYLARATRYQISMPMRFREAGETNWHIAKIENISRSGVLFTAENGLDVSAFVEMDFELPVKLAGAAPGHVYCEGQVARTVMPPATDRRSSVAARIKLYRLLPANE